MLPRFLAFLAAPLLLAGCTAGPRTTSTPPPRFDRGMVSAADPRAAEAGAEMLRQGGSATDAALATLLALTVVEPQSSGIGGGGFYVADDGKGHVDTIDGRETAPQAAGPDWFRMNGQYLSVPQAIPGGLSVGVPGNLRLMELAHQRHGRLPWKALFQPAIRLARDGFAVSPRLNQFLERAMRTGALTAEGRALYYLPEEQWQDPKNPVIFIEGYGKPKPAGETIRNPALASFLETLAAKGPGAFYAGANAQAVTTAVNTAPFNPAPMKPADLAAYRARQRPPVCVSYRAYRLCGMGPPSSGATTVFGVLGLLEHFDLHGLGKDNPVSWHLIAEAQRLTYADRERYLADSDFVPVPVAGLLAPDYLAARAQLIAQDRTMASVAPGNPQGVKVTQADTLTPDVPSTSHFVAVDRSGAAVSLTSTVESAFGSGLMANGYFLNNELTDFSLVPQRDGKPVANRVEGGKRPRSAMSPTLVYGPDGKLRLAIGAAGGATIPAQVLKAIIGVVDWDLSAQQAIALPVIFAPGGNTVFLEKGTALEAMAPALTALGHTDLQPREASFKANAVEVQGGHLQGAADPRSEGRAVGE
ncbi:MAG: gamma-glutamyltransferase family protein [Sphingomonadales bacterium]|nr:gamma-glutamyltransferase family protein [Sphingomonadales bacterium]